MLSGFSHIINLRHGLIFSLLRAGPVSIARLGSKNCSIRSVRQCYRIKKDAGYTFEFQQIKDLQAHRMVFDEQVLE